MPHTPSAKKNLRKGLKRRLHNRAVIKELKLQIKKVLATADSGTLDQLRQEYRTAAKKLDKAAAKRIVHPNLAARKKSQLARLLHGKEKEKASAAPAPAKKK
jgi:small subunit ribosomal protein S20